MVVFGHAVDHDGVRPVVIGQWQGGFAGAELRAHVERLERLPSEKRSHCLGLTMTEFGQSGIGAVGIVVHPMGLTMSDEHEIHSGRA